MNATAILDNLKAVPVKGLGAPLLLLVMLSMVVVPLPAFALDMLFTFNIALSLVVVLVVVYTMRPLDFEVFPSVLLVATLLRLGLNVASTRVVLLEGHEGGDAAGKVIEAFGQFVIGGNYAVGLVVFIILVIINFVVVTKGATRVSEVSARFTLDAMPGKQMAIDADLNAGLLTQEEARNRRAEIGREADFYGSMDGASKFVRGDAIAGILILVINIIGGLSIGMIQHGLSFGDASRNYILLTIGDGLVAQIPALLLSTATAIIVTRVSSSNDMGQQVLSQLLGDPRALYVAAGVMGGMGLIPGMPNLAFLSLAALAGGGAWWMNREKSEEAVAVAEQQAASMKPPSPEVKELTWDDVQPVDIIGLEVGYRLIPLVDKNQGGQLMQRIKGVRKKLSQELGFLIQPVHIRDNLELQANAYRITLMGVNVGESQIQPDKELAIDPGKVFGTLSGSHTTDPAFGLKAVWIEPGQKDYAQTLNYTVVDPSTVVATHLSQILQNHANELIGHEEVQQLMESLSRSAPKLVEDLVPKLLTHGQILKVLQNLLEEGIPVRDMRTIAETLAEHAAKSQDADVLTSAVRSSLGRMIVQQIVGTAPELEVFTLDPPLEQLLLKSLQAGAGDGISIDPESADRMLSMLGEAAGNQEAVGKPAVLLVNPAIRAKLSRFLRYSIGSLKVLAYTEIPADRQVRMIQSIGIQG